jgi:crotonobetainyl-CoA:carnitine CoA-transferase CaiB-like acyl-CoA transferase
VRLSKEDVPYAPILNYHEVETDPQIVHMQTFYETDHPVLGSVRGVQAPVWCDRMREVPKLPPPLLGEHTNEQARLAGFTDEQIAEFRAVKAI